MAAQERGDHLVHAPLGGEVTARHVIVAAQAPHAAPLVAPVAEQAAAALSRLTYGAFLTVGSPPARRSSSACTPSRPAPPR